VQFGFSCHQRPFSGIEAFSTTLDRPGGGSCLPAVLYHSRTLPQGDGCARPALAGGEEGGERDLVVLDTGNVLYDAVAVGAFSAVAAFARPACHDGDLFNSNSPSACAPTGYFNWIRPESELSRKVAVDFESDADFHKCGS